MNSEHQDIKAKLDIALKRISELEAENSRLRDLVAGDHQAVVSNSDTTATSVNAEHEMPNVALAERIDSTPASINNLSSPEEKVFLFKSLFQGRDDVFAIRWTGKDGKSGYSPACYNDWKLGVCGKYKKIPCTSCDSRKLIPLDDKQIYRHLSGEIVIGIYPLLDDDSCWFLTIDFDKKSWQEDVKTLLEICDKYQTPAYIEKSRSGNGAHVWLFFEEYITAAQARMLGTALLTKAMEDRHQISFDSYDRLFPNQDTMPKGGFGNLIALPLQKKVRENGNSEFIDHQLHRIEDQWAYLYQIKKISKNKISTVLSELLANQSAIGLTQTSLTETEEPLPWESIVTETEEFPDLPRQVQIILNNMIYIEKAGLTQKLMNRIMRLAVFQNPEFYRYQAMRMPIYNIPRIINLCAETDRHLAIPRGCMDDLSKLFDNLGIQIAIQDLRNEGIKINATFIGELRPEQLLAGKTMLTHDNGILSAAPAFGKTVVAIWMIAQMNVNTLIIVHRRQLMEQWLERLNYFLNDAELGQIGAGRDKRTGKIDVAIIQSLNHKGEVKELVKDYGMIIVDECHHISAFSFEQVLKTANAKYVYGLTATPLRKDGHHPIVYMQCGQIRYKVDAKSLIQYRSFSHKVITRYTEFQMPTIQNGADFKITEIYQALIEDTRRNDIILDDIIAAITAGRSPLVLTQRTAHVEFFANKLAGFSKHVIILRGGMGRKQIKAVMEKLHSIPEEDERVIISTGKYIGEGFDDSRLDTLFLTMPISWKGVLQQYAGRLHRAHDGKTEVVIYDYVDSNVPVLAAMYQKRLKGYGGMGYVLT